MNQYILNGSAYLELGEVVGVVALPSPTAFYVDNKTYLLLESQTGFVKGLFYKCREVTPATDPKTYEWYAVNDEIENLATKINELEAISGEFLPISDSSTSKKRTAAVGATSCQFYVGGFMQKYEATANDLDFYISSATANGSVVAYNRVAVNSSSGYVYIYFDALAEQTTFVCKAMKIS